MLTVSIIVDLDLKDDLKDSPECSQRTRMQVLENLVNPESSKSLFKGKKKTAAAAASSQL